MPRVAARSSRDVASNPRVPNDWRAASTIRSLVLGSPALVATAVILAFFERSCSLCADKRATFGAGLMHAVIRAASPDRRGAAGPRGASARAGLDSVGGARLGQVPG